MSSKFDASRIQRVQQLATAREQEQTKQFVQTEKLQQDLKANDLWTRIRAQIVARLAKVRSPDNFAREGVKLAIVLGAPILFTFILTQPQFGERIILKYTPYIENKVSDTKTVIRQYYTSSRRSIDSSDDLYFKKKEETDDKVRSYLAENNLLHANHPLFNKDAPQQQEPTVQQPQSQSRLQFLLNHVEKM